MTYERLEFTLQSTLIFFLVWKAVVTVGWAIIQLCWVWGDRLLR